MKKPAIPEKLIQSTVIKHWRALGLPDTLVAAAPNARAFGQPGLTRGLFDLVVIGGPVLGDRTGWIELKASGGVLSKDQEFFKGLLVRKGIPYAVTFGLNEPIAVLQEWGVVRKSKVAA